MKYATYIAIGVVTLIALVSSIVITDYHSSPFGANNNSVATNTTKNIQIVW